MMNIDKIMNKDKFYAIGTYITSKFDNNKYKM